MLEAVNQVRLTIRPDNDNPWLRGPYAPNATEFNADTDSMQVIGEIPKDLDGMYVRNTHNQVHEPLGEVCLRRHLVEIGGVHERGGLLLDGADEVRMAMAEDIHRDAAGEIQPFPALRVIEVTAVSAHRLDLATAIDGHEGRDGHDVRSVLRQGNCANAKRRS